MEETKKKNPAGGKGNKPQAPPKENRGDNKNQGKQSESAHASGASSPVNNSGSTRSVPYSKKASRSHLVLFDHLPHKGISKNNDHISQDPLLHPMTCKLRTFYQNGVIREDDDRVVALIGAFSKIIQSYTTPPNSNLSWDLDKVIKLQVRLYCILVEFEVYILHSICLNRSIYSLFSFAGYILTSFYSLLMFVNMITIFYLGETYR